MSNFNLDNRKFTALFNSVNGQVNHETTFNYHQKGEYIWANYSGGDIVIGTLSGRFVEEDKLHFRYGHWDHSDQFRSGTCSSTLSKLPDGKIRIHEQWAWDDDSESGESTLVEID